MAEVVTLSLALRPVRIELSDEEFAAELRAESEGFILPDDTEPWLTMTVTCHHEEKDELKSVTVKPQGEGKFLFLGPRSEGTYRTKPHHTAQGAVTNITALYQFIYLCLSMSLPREGGLLLHADTVEWKDGAVSFLGRSGQGKSTAALHMLRRGAHWIAVDRTAVFMNGVGDAAEVVTLPAFGRKRCFVGRPWTTRLSGLLFPYRGRGANITPISRLEACKRLLRAVILPAGSRLPVDEALRVAESIVGDVWAGALVYEVGNDFTVVLDAMRMHL